MPETAINENYRLILRENYVGFAREIFPVKTEAVSKSVQDGANDDLRTGVYPFYSGHIPASVDLRDSINHEF